MLSTLLVLGGVLVGLFVLLALIVSLSARPQPPVRTRRDLISDTTGQPGRTWAADVGRPHPDAWSPLSTTSTSEIPAIR
jgi:hypothetical protein